MAKREGISRQGRLLLAVLVAATLVSLWRAVTVEHEKRKIAGAYDEAKTLVDQLTEEQQHLTQELATSRKSVDVQAGELASLRLDLRNVQDKLDQTVVELATLQRESDQLRQDKASLVTELSAISTERQELEQRLSNLKELRLAIRDVKQRMSDERWAAWRARIQAQQDVDREELAKGNRGFVVHSGRSTLGASPRLHVHVLEPQSLEPQSQ
jgi:chromosome segregation ATPase